MFHFSIHTGLYLGFWTVMNIIVVLYLWYWAVFTSKKSDPTIALIKYIMAIVATLLFLFSGHHY